MASNPKTISLVTPISPFAVSTVAAAFSKAFKRSLQHGRVLAGGMEKAPFGKGRNGEGQNPETRGVFAREQGPFFTGFGLGGDFPHALG